MHVKSKTHFEEVGVESEAIFGGGKGSTGSEKEGKGIVVEGACGDAHLGVEGEALEGKAMGHVGM